MPFASETLFDFVNKQLIKHEEFMCVSAQSEIIMDSIDLYIEHKISDAVLKIVEALKND